MWAKAPLIARYTWVRQWPAFALDGIALGVIGLAAFAAKRSLGGDEAVVPLLVALWQVVWILAPAIGTLLAKADPQRLWRRLAVATFTPLLLVGCVAVHPLPTHGYGTGNLPLFVVLMFAHYATAVANVPHRGALLRANYPASVRGRMYGALTAIGFACAALGAKTAGLLLDRDPRWLRVVFPLAALAGGAGYLVQSRVRWRGQRHSRIYRALAERPLAAMRRAWSEAVDILGKDVRFRTYEIGFMLYGAGFLWSVGLLVLYAEQDLGLSYDQFTWAQFFAWPLGQICAAPMWGRLADRIGIEAQTGLAFCVLACFFTLMLGVDTAGELIAAYALFGIAMGGVNIGWSLGPLHFAPDGRAHMYAAVHFSMVGVRSVFAPFLGLLVKQHASFQAAFAMSAGLVVLGAATMFRLSRRSRAPAPA